MKQSTIIHLLTTVVSVSFIAGCSPKTSTPTDSLSNVKAEASAQLQQSAELKVSYDAPEGWEQSGADDMMIYTAPEENAVFAVVSIDEAENAEAAAKAAWARYDADFSRAIQLNTEEAAGKGWDDAHQIIYETSPAEEHIARAYVRTAQGQWKVILIDGKLGTIVKRQAAALGLLDSFVVEGYAAENLSDRTANELTPERVRQLTDFVAASADSLGIPGVGIALIQNGEVVFEGGVGVKAHGSNALVDKDTRFMIASNTKGMTTLLLAKLVEMGRLDWDDPVTDHYPTFKLGDKATTESVLIKHLICACTGLPRKDMEWAFNSGPDAPASSAFEDLAATAPTSEFGELFQYNNQMAAAAGYVAGHVL